jgi:hypothetical protein
MPAQAGHKVQQTQALLMMLVVCGAASIMSSMGFLLGKQADLIAGVDAGIVGMIAGAVLGSSFPVGQSLNPAIRSVAAGLGVLLPTLALVGSARVAPEVLAGITVVAMMGSAVIGLGTRLARRVRR